MTLLDPIKVGAFELPNRMIVAPCGRVRAGATRLANDFMREYYEMRAEAGLIITECSAVSEEGYCWNGVPAFYTQAQADSWKPITKAVHNKGGRIFLQIWHGGRQGHSSLNHGKQIVAPSAIKVPGDGHIRDINYIEVPFEVPRALEIEEIEETVKDFGKAAALAKDAGFDGVEIHAANGYLIDTFLQSSTNQRTDRYGGSKDRRFNFLKEVIEEVGKVFPYDRMGVRFSPNGSFGGMGSPDNVESFSYFANRLNEYNLAYLHVMDGTTFGFHEVDRPMTLFDIKKNYNGIIISNVGHTQESAEGTLRTGTADLISFGRLFISNPDLVNRFRNNWPLNPLPPFEHWWGTKPDPKDCLEGYLTYRPYTPTN